MHACYACYVCMCVCMCVCMYAYMPTYLYTRVYVLFYLRFTVHSVPRICKQKGFRSSCHGIPESLNINVHIRVEWNRFEPRTSLNEVRQLNP